jgi:hypothetical protein
MENNNESAEPAGARPLGFWLRTVDRLLSAEFARALGAEGVDRRDWMLLNAVDGSVDAPWLAERLARKSGRVRRLADRGWIAEEEGRWSLTDEGRAAKERLGSVVDGIRERVSGAVSAEDYATTIATLAAIAEELGGTDAAADHQDVRGRRFGRGGFGRGGFGRGGFGGPFGPGFGGFGDRGFGPGFGGPFGPGFEGFGGHRPFGPGEHGFGPDGRGFAHEAAPCHPRGHGHGYGHGRGHRHEEHAYERGFAAGFERGRAAASEPVA